MNPALPHWLQFFIGLPVALIIIGLYLLPAIVAIRRQHPSRQIILLLNLFFGWSGIGWLLCLAWALSRTIGTVVRRDFTPVDTMPCPRCAEICRFCGAELAPP